MTKHWHHRIDRWTRVLHWALRAVVTVTVLGVVVPLIVLTASFVRIVWGFSGTAQLPADCIVVFGNAVHPTGVPGPGIERRIATAARLVHEGLAQRLIVSGGLPQGYVLSEAQAMRTVAVQEGVDPAVITMEDRARSTWENLLFSRPLTEGCASVVGLSDRYHLARIRLLASRQGWGSLQTYPADDLPLRASELKSFVRETLAYAYYWLHIDVWYPLAPEAT